MKLTSFLTHATIISGAAFLLGLAFGSHAFGLFATATASSILLIASHDYAPRLPTLASRHATGTQQTLPLAV